MRRLLLCAAMLLYGAADAAAQTTTCDWIDRPGSSLQVQNSGMANESAIMIRPHLRCEGGRELTADQGTRTGRGATGLIQLFGNVVVEDTDRILRAAQASFFSSTRQLAATGNVTLTDKRTGSIIRGDLLNYWQESPTRPQARIEATATTGLARAILFAEDTPERGRDSTIVDASQININGEDSFIASGNAVMLRDSMRTTGRIIAYSKEGGTLDVMGNGRVEMTDQDLSGDSITATLDENEEIREVLVRHRAVLESPDMSVTAPAVRLFLAEGGVERMVAMQWPAMPGAPAPAQASVVAENFSMQSDSIDVLAPGQELSEAVAIGNAYGERVRPDSMRALLPDAPADVMSLIENDWMRGDTVRAAFAPNPAAAADTTAAAQIMESLTATGSPAQSMYSMRDENAPPDAKLSLNYLTSSRIDIRFIDGLVAVVAAEGDARGVYLQPAQLAQRAPGAAIPPAAGIPPEGM